MQFTEEAIIISSNKYGENSGIVCLLTASHGIYKGLVRSISGKQNRGIYQIGNIVEATWRGRLPEHLGNISAGLLHSGAMSIMDNPAKLAALSSICAILEATLQERDPADSIYTYFRNLLTKLGNNTADWQKSYVLLELELLAQIGYGIDLTECVDTGTRENLIYVSPKSGCAVCAASGEPYHDKLLKLPDFLLNKHANHNIAQINDGVALSGYFLDKYFFTPHNISQPQARTRFINILKAQNTSTSSLRGATRRGNPY